MAARPTAMKMTGIALASLCSSMAARAQVGYTGPVVGCFGVMCVPVVSIGAYTRPGFTVAWALGLPAFSSRVAPPTFGPQGVAWGYYSSGAGSSSLASNRVRGDDDGQRGRNGRSHQNDQGDQDDQGNRDRSSHVSAFNPATVVYAGLAATALVSFINSSSGASAAPVVASSEITPVMAVPITAHVEFAPATALMATTELVTTPEPLTQTLVATGLVALGLFVSVRRRRLKA